VRNGEDASFLEPLVAEDHIIDPLLDEFFPRRNLWGTRQCEELNPRHQRVEAGHLDVVI
jgi:hypothetical protein